MAPDGLLRVGDQEAVGSPPKRWKPWLTDVHGVGQREMIGE